MFHSTAPRLIAAALLFAATAAASDRVLADAVAADEILVVDEKDLDRMWKLKRGARPMHHGGSVGKACVTIGYVIEPDGTTSTHRVLRSEPPGVLDKAGIAMIRKWRFEPGPDNAARAPVYSTGGLAHGFFQDTGARQRRQEGCRVDIVPPVAGT